MPTSIGTETRTQFCETHKREYIEIYFPRIPGQEPFWSGLCSDCAAEQRVIAQAQYMEEQTRQETYALAETLASSEEEIQAAVDTAIEAYIESCREEAVSRREDFEFSIREQAAENAVISATNIRVEKFVEEIKQGGRHGVSGATVQSSCPS